MKNHRYIFKVIIKLYVNVEYRYNLKKKLYFDFYKTKKFKNILPLPCPFLSFWLQSFVGGG